LPVCLPIYTTSFITTNRIADVDGSTSEAACLQMRACGACQREVGRKKFSPNQWSKGSGVSRCIECVKQGVQITFSGDEKVGGGSKDRSSEQGVAQLQAQVNSTRVGARSLEFDVRLLAPAIANCWMCEVG
jgi:hypothetical protein